MADEAKYQWPSDDTLLFTNLSEVAQAADDAQISRANAMTYFLRVDAAIEQQYAKVRKARKTRNHDTLLALWIAQIASVNLLSILGPQLVIRMDKGEEGTLLTP